MRTFLPFSYKMSIRLAALMPIFRPCSVCFRGFGAFAAGAFLISTVTSGGVFDCTVTTGSGAACPALASPVFVPALRSCVCLWKNGQAQMYRQKQAHPLLRGCEAAHCPRQTGSSRPLPSESALLAPTGSAQAVLQPRQFRLLRPMYNRPGSVIVSSCTLPLQIVRYYA